MTAPAGLAALRQPGLGSADRAGLLPAAAAAGAQVRSVLAASADLPEMDRPRAMVVVGADAPADTAFLLALVGRNAAAPLVATTSVPPWVGPLDVVVVLAGGPDDEAAAEAAGIARRRGATTVVRGSASGPVAAAAGPSLFPPAVAVPEFLAVAGRWSLLTMVAVRAGLAPRVDLSRTADLLDATAVACHPDAENFVNPGINLAEYLAGGTPLLIGCDRLADTIAAHGVRVLADVAGVAASLLGSASAATSPALLRRAATTKDLFADPFDDAEPPAQVVSPLLVSTAAQDTAGGALVEAAADRRVLAGMVRSFPGSMHLDASPDSLPTVSGLGEWPVEGGGPRSAGGADAFDAAVAACLRMDFAAVYVGIATGQLPPMDPDGLGRGGDGRWSVSPAAVSSAWNESRF